jgi:hypothetical protein
LEYLNATINWWEWFGAARAPSEIKIEIILTTNWKSLKKDAGAIE